MSELWFQITACMYDCSDGFRTLFWWVVYGQVGESRTFCRLGSQRYPKVIVVATPLHHMLSDCF